MRARAAPVVASMPGMHRRQRVPVIGLSRKGLGMDDELPALRRTNSRGNAHFDAELIGLVRLAFADALHLRGMKRVNLRPPLAAFFGLTPDSSRTGVERRQP